MQIVTDNLNPISGPHPPRPPQEGWPPDPEDTVTLSTASRSSVRPAFHPCPRLAQWSSSGG